jgi:prepilin-type N-terminal cleavage/methylation domain-containing protein
MLNRGTKARRHQGTQGRARRGFTLIELMVAIGIIVIIMALAVPAYRFIVGNRSQDAAVNLIEAMLGRARGHAIGTQRHAGVVFFVNPVDQRVTMSVVVERMPDADADEDLYLNYKARSDKLGPRDNPEADALYARGQEVIGTVVALDEDPVTRVQTRRNVVRRFHYLPQNPNNGALPNPVPPDANVTWGSLGVGLCMDFVMDGELQALPNGVGCQLINDPKNVNVPDRYVQTGCIIFDPQGQLTSIDLAIARYGALGKLLLLEADIPAANVTFKSQLGVVLFDPDAFRSKGGGTFSDSVVAVKGYDSMGDKGWEPVGGQASYGPSEQKEEAWLDQNGLQLLVSRYSGTLLRGE